MIFHCKFSQRYYRSIILYHSDNTHITGVVRVYKEFLHEKRVASFIRIIFEELFSLIEKHADSSSVKECVAYLKRSYIPIKEAA